MGTKEDAIRTLRELFSFSGRISAVRFFTVALLAVFCKHVLDIAIAWYFHRTWDPRNYIFPLGIPTSAADIGLPQALFLITMLAFSVPFVWLGVALCARRFRTVGWPAWTIVFFFVPVVNVITCCVATALPDRSEREEGRPTFLERWIPDTSFGAAFFALCVTVFFGLLVQWIGTKLFAVYGWGLFVAAPFVQGALSAWLFGVHRRRALAASIGVAMLSITLTGVVMFCVAFEGAVCLMMAMPIAYVFGILGAFFGHCLQRNSRSASSDMAVLVVLLLASPTLMGLEAALPQRAPLYAVRTSVVVDAPPAAVWRNVIAFPDLPLPTEVLFRAGVAYPQRAHIVGMGVGAVRYCEFSTGAFVEPITAWEPGRALAFDVVRNPEPMQEWSPYGHIDTPHLHGYMLSRRGRFDLRPLPGGKTLLVGTTWYQHHLWPASYWRLWSDAVIHQIHRRVLEHIKRLSELPARESLH